MKPEHTSYGWSDDHQTCAHDYLLPAVLAQVQAISRGRSLRILDLGCGNGFVASKLAQSGHAVIGVDISQDGIEIARAAYPSINFVVASLTDENLVETVGEVDCVVALEVVEHLFYPKTLFEQSYCILKNDGHLLISTPYHGYFKNLALSLVNGWDRHFNVEWDGGHIKFFSNRTLALMAGNAGFTSPQFFGVGRVPPLWKSTIMIVKK